jgi:glycine/D-amino acid oxidase-like deaminating enzyme
MTPATVSLIDPALTACVPIIPVVGQMFSTERSSASLSGATPLLHHLVSSMESSLYWKTHPPTQPPRVTHEREGAGDGSATGLWGSRLARHLYGKQSSDGRFIFGGDRRVHPTQAQGSQHPLPRLVDDMHSSVHEHACEVVPAVAGLRVEHQWGGIMPFSADDRPILGPLPLPQLPGRPHESVWVITGLGPSGFMRGPMSGLLVAEALLGNEKAARLLKEGGADPMRFTV